MDIETPKGTYPCKVCGKKDHEKAMCFRGENWCSELHRKVLIGEEPWPEQHVAYRRQWETQSDSPPRPQRGDQRNF